MKRNDIGVAVRDYYMVAGYWGKWLVAIDEIIIILLQKTHCIFMRSELYVIQICSSYLQNSFQKLNIRNSLMNLEGSDDYVI